MAEENQLTINVEENQETTKGPKEVNTKGPKEVTTKDLKRVQQGKKLAELECYMDWFPSLICKNYIFKHFVKTVEPMSLKFCMIIELITLHLECIIAQVKYSNFSCMRRPSFC